MSKPRSVLWLLVLGLVGTLPPDRAGVVRANGPAVSPGLLRAQWPASWIAAPGAPERDPVVFHVRRILELPETPPTLVVHVSGDQRYELRVNGQRVGAGPARSDVHHWIFETYDIAPFLQPGRNVVAATVWSFGLQAPMAQMSRRTAFLLQADDPSWVALNTGPGWEAQISQGHGLNPDGLTALRRRHFYYAAGPGERRDARRFDWDWDTGRSDPRRWEPAVSLGRAHPRSIREGPGWMQSPEGWLLVPSPLPPMYHRSETPGSILRAAGLEAYRAFPIAVPARARVRLLLGRPDIVNAYPAIVTSGGAGSRIRVTYAEALYDASGAKGNRAEIDGKEILGLVDEFVADGGAGRRLAPLWFRTWRYLELDVETEDAPLTIDGVEAFATGFPFVRRASFESDDPELRRIWDVGWRTAELAAHETYMDAPYWEQLQYIGDTRIDALISYAVAGDDRLARRALELFDLSRTAEGLTQSRYPTAELQYIPPYSLFYVLMVHDFWMHRDDPAFVRARLPGTRPVLDWFIDRQRDDGLLGFLPFWVHGDTSTVLDDAIQEPDGGSGVITLQYLVTLRAAAELERALGDPARAERYVARARAAERGIAGLWDPSRGLFADTPARRSWGHPVNIFVLIAGVVPPGAAGTLLEKVVAVGRHPAGRAADGGKGAAWPLEQIPSASLYFRFYLARALEGAGAGDDYIALLAPWREMLRLGLTTWPEHPEPTRSDCHAWSAHPTLDLLRVVAGIAPAAPGFARVRIAPALGPLGRVRAEQPHPRGTIRVELRRLGAGLEGTIALPPGVDGELTWRGRTRSLAAGEQYVRVP